VKRHGIERQMLAVAVIPILILALLLEGYFTYARFADRDRALLERARLIVRQIALSAEYPVFSGNQSLLQQQVDTVFKQKDVRSIAVMDGIRKIWQAQVIFPISMNLSPWKNCHPVLAI
jgi:hypothetical protein